MFGERGQALTIDVPRKKLLKALQENRELHRKIYAEAVEGFRRAAVQLLERELKTRREHDTGPLKRLSVKLDPPQEHLEEYDTAINMLGWAVDDTIELTAEQFSNLVEDKWHWKKNWLEANVLYSRTARGE